MIVQLEQWAVGQDADPYMAPESNRHFLVGIVYGHPVKPDGTRVRTNYILDAHNRNISTESGTVYRLGEPDPAYLEYLKTINRAYNPECPIEIKKYK